MDENELRKTYLDLQDIPCSFEKIILSGRCGCGNAQKFNLAEREGISCAAQSAQLSCTEFLRLVHEHARFALHLTHITGPLPHAKEIKVQGGGLMGLRQTLEPDSESESVDDIHALITDAKKRFGALADVPMEEVIRSISHYQGRSMRPAPGTE